MILGGLVATVVGWALIIKNDSIINNTDWNDANYDSERARADRILMPGIIMGFGGLLPWIGGVMRQSKNRYEYSVVDGMSEEYNRKLIQQIKGTTP